MELRPHLDYTELIESFEDDVKTARMVTKRLSSQVFSSINTKNHLFTSWLYNLDSVSNLKLVSSFTEFYDFFYECNYFNSVVYVMKT